MRLPPCAAGAPESIYQTLKPYYDPNLIFPENCITKGQIIFQIHGQTFKPQTLKRHYERPNIFPYS